MTETWGKHHTHFGLFSVLEKDPPVHIFGRNTFVYNSWFGLSRLTAHFHAQVDEAFVLSTLLTEPGFHGLCFCSDGPGPSGLQLQRFNFRKLYRAADRILSTENDQHVFIEQRKVFCCNHPDHSGAIHTGHERSAQSGQFLWCCLRPVWTFQFTMLSRFHMLAFAHRVQCGLGLIHRWFTQKI